MSQLQRTPLYQLHLNAEAKMVPFAGYEMPVQYTMGVKKEHLQTREQAGLFDVSHMGQIKLSGANAAAELEKLVPVDIIDLPEGKQRYAFFTNHQGGILDDLMISNFGDHLIIVANAACKEADLAHLQKHLPANILVEVLDRALVALQGPKAAEALARLCPDVEPMVFMDTRAVQIAGTDCLVSRSGYTGEDGFEISIASADAEQLCLKLLEQPEVALIGLGARDSLRLEAGLCLYGHDLDNTTTPVEASLLWAVSKVRREGGERPGNYLGADVINQQISSGSHNRKRVGLIAQGKAPVREGATLENANGEAIGTVTSGSFSPSLGQPVAMAYIDPQYANVDTEIYAIVRGKQQLMRVSRMPFVPQRYYRG